MKFSEIADQAVVLLRGRGRVSYGALQAELDLPDKQLELLKEELLFSHREISEVDGRGLVWNGAGDDAPVQTAVAAQSQLPVSYTPAHLAERILAERAAMKKRGATDGERKTITALFADLKGSTALIERLDPEEARSIIDPALQLMMDAIHRYDGYVAQVLGDGIFALFGAPIAHEDHPQRALYAALQLQDKMRRYSDELRRAGRAPLQTRVGVNTGEGVVRSIRKDDLHTDYVPIGHSTNLAARMEQLADPGSILVTEQTCKLTDGYFEFKALGETLVKGVDGPLKVYEVLGAGPLRTKLQISARRGLTRFVGRQSETDQLSQALAQAKKGHGQIVGVMGEPGLGKSRLFYEFKLTSQTGCLVLEAFSVSHSKTSPYLPIIELLKDYFEIVVEDDERKRREKVTGKVLALDRSLKDTLPYLFSLLGIEEQTSSLQQMDPQIRRQRTFDALKKLFLRESLNQPLMVIFEDLHWIDNETQGFLDTLSESGAGARILLLVNYRPEYRHDWGRKTYYTQLHLAPLGQDEAEELLTVLLGNDTSLKALKQLILERTEGTPFFMEEVMQTLAEENVLLGERGHYRLEKTPAELHISPTVQGVLASRIDRLTAEEKHLLQHLAVIGREFPLGLVRKVVARPEGELSVLLSSLQAKEFLYEQLAFPDVEYVFKHALTQEVAYGTVLREQRETLHEETGEAIEALYGASLEDHYSKLAHHYRHSGNIVKAVTYLHLAGEQAVQRSAYAEAETTLTAALNMLQTLADTPSRAEQELALQTSLGSVFLATRAYTAQEVEQTYARARAFCQQLDDPSRLIPVLAGLWLFHFIRAEHELARELAEEVSKLARHTQVSSDLLSARYVLGQSLVVLGEFTAAQQELRLASECYDANQHHVLAASYGEDPGSVSLSFEANALFILGYPDQALRRAREAITLVETLGHDFTLAQAVIWLAFIRQYRREPQAMQEDAERALTVASECNFPYFVLCSALLLAEARVEQGELVQDIDQLRSNVDDYQASDAALFTPYFLSFVACAEAGAGNRERGLDLIDQALSQAARTRERWHEAELHRIKGELTLRSSGACPDSAVQKAAEECFHEALETAREQSAKSWELRAAMSLARLWQQQDKHTEAHQLLSEIYDWFAEGFDTKDLREARALLDTLA